MIIDLSKYELNQVKTSLNLSIEKLHKTTYKDNLLNYVKEETITSLYGIINKIENALGDNNVQILKEKH